MQFRQQLLAAERLNDSLLCVGLDPEPDRFPGPWRGEAGRIFDFCSAIVDATRDLVIAFKPQIAHFAARRAEAQLERLIEHIHRVAPGVPVILDAKRGDVGSTAAHYAVEAFERYRADAVTLSPFMGYDSIEPYLRYAGKGVILLCRTSNAGGADLQAQQLAGPEGEAGDSDGNSHGNNRPERSGDRDTLGNAGRAGGDRLFERIARLAAGRWNAGSGELALVVGATCPDDIARVRALAPTLPLLIPGIGTQGGDAAATVRAGWRGAAGRTAGETDGRTNGPATAHTTGPIIVSSSRAILYAAEVDPAHAANADMTRFAEAARAAALAARQLLNDAKGG